MCRAVTGQGKTHPTLELGCDFSVPWRMVNEIPIPREGGIGVPGPKGGEVPSLTGAVHGVREARKKVVLLLPVSTLLPFRRAASFSQGSLCQTSQERPERAAQHKVRGCSC